MRRHTDMSVAIAVATVCFLWTGHADAQSVTLDLGGNEGSLSSRIIQIIALVSILSVAPGLVIMATCFTRIVVVLSLVRSALGLAPTPPHLAIGRGSSRERVCQAVLI